MTLSIDIAQLVPHQGAMCLHQRVLSWTPTQIALAASSHRDIENPLRRDGRLHAIVLCEYGAQAMAVHGGLLAQTAGKAGKPGFLVSLRAVELFERHIDQLEGELLIEAEQLLQSADSQQYRFVVSHAKQILARGRAAVVLQSAGAMEGAT